MDGQMDVWLGKRLHGWMDGWMDTYTVLKYSLDSASVLSQRLLHPRISDF